MATMFAPYSALGTAFTECDNSPRTETSSIALTEVPGKRYKIFWSREGRRPGAPRLEVERGSGLPVWFIVTLETFEKILALPEGWDSYDAVAIKPQLILKAFETLCAIMTEISPTPNVVPLSDGGIQLEWHRYRQDLEITFPVNESPQFFYRNNETGEEKEGGANALGLMSHFLHYLD